MKNSPSITKLLLKVSYLLDEIDKISKYIRNQQAFKGITVTFYHDEQRLLLLTKWSDQYYGTIDSILNQTKFTYEYEITSKGIHFLSYTERDLNSPWWQSKVSWNRSGDEKSIKLIQVPNLPPLNYKGTMYLFHQEKIKESMSMLPAWAIGIMS